VTVLLRFSLICVSTLLFSCAHLKYSSEKIAQTPPAPTVLKIPERAPAFFSKRATEATLTFSHRARLQAARKPSKTVAEEQVQSQLAHLFGPMERAEYAAVPKEDHVIKITKIERTPGVADSYEIHYDYEGTIVVEKGPRSKIDLVLPIDPTTIFQDAMVGNTNPCTDDHYQSEGDFWYFWGPSPFYPNCRLKENVHYEIVKGDIDRLKPLSRKTYPEYERLFDDGILDMHIFFGLDEPKHGHNPNKSADVNAETYKETRKELLKMGFSIRKWTAEETANILTTSHEGPAPFVEEAEKVYADKSLKIRIRLFFGEIGINENSRPFHYFFRDALKNAAIMIYDGHSGLGGHLDLSAIQKANGFRINMPKNRYQVYYFNSCTSYTYYNTLYFQKKRGRIKIDDPKGTKNLDILANGLSTSFDVLSNGNMTIIKAIDKWSEHGKRTSYQDMASAIDSDNLFTVNGDEDNARN
jgi:hypothetical protein